MNEQLTDSDSPLPEIGQPISLEGYKQRMASYGTFIGNASIDSTKPSSNLDQAKRRAEERYRALHDLGNASLTITAVTDRIFSGFNVLDQEGAVTTWFAGDVRVGDQVVALFAKEQAPRQYE